MEHHSVVWTAVLMAGQKAVWTAVWRVEQTVAESVAHWVVSSVGLKAERLVVRWALN